MFYKIGIGAIYLIWQAESLSGCNHLDFAQDYLLIYLHILTIAYSFFIMFI